MADASADEPAVVIERRSGGGMGIFLLGVAIGAGLALLYAPKAGSETRADLRHGARRMRRKARDLGEEVQDAAHDFARSTRDAARETRAVLEQRLARRSRAASRVAGVTNMSDAGGASGDVGDEDAAEGVGV